jgi:hypothetical protein
MIAVNGSWTLKFLCALLRIVLLEASLVAFTVFCITILKTEQGGALLHTLTLYALLSPLPRYGNSTPKAALEFACTPLACLKVDATRQVSNTRQGSEEAQDGQADKVRQDAEIGRHRWSACRCPETSRVRYTAEDRDVPSGPRRVLRRHSSYPSLSPSTNGSLTS